MTKARETHAANSNPSKGDKTDIPSRLRYWSPATMSRNSHGVTVIESGSALGSLQMVLRQTVPRVRRNLPKGVPLHHHFYTHCRK